MRAHAKAVNSGLETSFFRISGGTLSEKKVTILDVAKAAGVSVGSTSRVLNNVAGVKPKTRNAVLKAAKKLNYTPNQAARALRTRSSGQIGIQFTDLSNPLQIQLYGNLVERFAEAGFVSLMSTSSNHVERERQILQSFMERGLDALVAAPVNETDPAINDLLAKFPAPVILIDREMEVTADHVNYDHKDAMRIGLDYLMSLGHRRIAPVFGSFARRPGLMRQAAFEDAARRSQLNLLDCPWIQPATPSTPVTAETIKVLSSPNRPTALIVQGTQVLHSVLNAVAVMGLRIPEDISILAVGDSNLTADHMPAMSVLTLDQQELVDTISNRVLEKVRGQATGCADFSLNYRLIERESCGPPSHS